MNLRVELYRLQREGAGGVLEKFVEAVRSPQLVACTIAWPLNNQGHDGELLILDRTELPQLPQKTRLSAECVHGSQKTKRRSGRLDVSSLNCSPFALLPRPKLGLKPLKYSLWTTSPPRRSTRTARVPGMGWHGATRPGAQHLTWMARAAIHRSTAGSSTPSQPAYENRGERG